MQIFKYNICYLTMVKMRPKTIRIIESIHSKGVFGPCSCGGEVLYYTDRGVRCSTCGKLYGVWANRQRSLVQRARELLLQTQGVRREDEGFSEDGGKPKEFSEAPRKSDDYSEFETVQDDVELTV